LIVPSEIYRGKLSAARDLFRRDRAEVRDRFVVMNRADVIAPAIGEVRTALCPEQKMVRYAIEERLSHGLDG
jgi:hypothetical protein